MHDLGSVLRKMRKKAGMSQEDVALDLHMSISNISRLESGKYELKVIDFWRWANSTGTQDIMIATLTSVDLSVVQQILDSGTTFVNFINFIM